MRYTSRDPLVHAFKMAAKQVAETVGKTVFKPLLSTSHVEARRRVLNLYRAWWREVLISCILSSKSLFACSINVLKPNELSLLLQRNICEMDAFRNIKKDFYKATNCRFILINVFFFQFES